MDAHPFPGQGEKAKDGCLPLDQWFLTFQML